MIKPLIELTQNESGDWKVLRMSLGEDFEYQGHSIPNYKWIELIKKLGYKVTVKGISDEDMEDGNF